MDETNSMVVNGGGWQLRMVDCDQKVTNDGEW